MIDVIIHNYTILSLIRVTNYLCSRHNDFQYLQACVLLIMVSIMLYCYSNINIKIKIKQSPNCIDCNYTCRCLFAHELNSKLLPHAAILVLF